MATKPVVRKFPALEGFDAHMGHARTLRKLYQDAAFRARFVEHLATEAGQYLNEQRANLELFLETKDR